MHVVGARVHCLARGSGALLALPRAGRGCTAGPAHPGTVHLTQVEIILGLTPLQRWLKHPRFLTYVDTNFAYKWTAS